jgi:N-acetylneuraminic acid mutarotase
MLRKLPIALGVCLAVTACTDSPTTNPAGPSDALESQALVSSASNTWARLTQLRAGRAQVAGAAVGNVIYLVGGWGRGAMSTATLQAYDVETDRWSARAPMPAARREVNGASLIDGRLYVAGGVNNNDVNYLAKTLFVYDPATNSWTRKADMPRVGACGAQAVIARKLYVYSGCGHEHDEFFRYDPETDQWSTLPRPPSQHSSSAGGVLQGKFYLVGGELSFGQPNLAMHVYDPVSRSWSTKAPLPSEQRYPAAGVLNGKLYVAGGQNDFQVTATHRVYDPATNTWTARAPMLTTRYAAAGVVAGGRFFVLGGFGRDDGPRPVEYNEAFTP